jgi:uncharacterized C2H2 Zn-finger protein
MTIELLRCPFCGLMFVSDFDREKHLDVFGREKVDHMERLRNENEDLVEDSFKLHGGADDGVHEVEREILRERRRRVEIMFNRVTGRTRLAYDYPGGNDSI